MAEENISQEFRLKNIDETKSYFIENLNQNELIWATLSYIEHFLILASTITWCVTISAFASFIRIPVGIMSSAIGLKFFAITAGIKKYKSIIKKKKTKHDRIVLLAKSKLNSTEVLIFKALIDWVFSHDEFVLINNVMK